MNVILDPGALMAAKIMSTDRAYSAMPNAPMVPDRLPRSRHLLSARRTLAGGLAALADWVRPRERHQGCTVAPGH
jgi:hypothetical protein